MKLPEACSCGYGSAGSVMAGAAVVVVVPVVDAVEYLGALPGQALTIVKLTWSSTGSSTRSCPAPGSVTPPYPHLDLLLCSTRVPARRRRQRPLRRGFSDRGFEGLLDQAVPAQEFGAVVLERAKLAECVAPGRGSGTVALAFADVCTEHRAASFRLLQRQGHQCLGLA